jgi:hypothetical protein
LVSRVRAVVVAKSVFVVDITIAITILSQALFCSAALARDPSDIVNALSLSDKLFITGVLAVLAAWTVSIEIELWRQFSALKITPVLVGNE